MYLSNLYIIIPEINKNDLSINYKVKVIEIITRHLILSFNVNNNNNNKDIFDCDVILNEDNLYIRKKIKKIW
jgi:hypothetical protein